MTTAQILEIGFRNGFEVGLQLGYWRGVATALLAYWPARLLTAGLFRVFTYLSRKWSTR